jgi:hypothetical protein
MRRRWPRGWVHSGTLVAAIVASASSCSLQSFDDLSSQNAGAGGGSAGTGTAGRANPGAGAAGTSSNGGAGGSVSVPAAGNGGGPGEAGSGSGGSGRGGNGGGTGGRDVSPGDGGVELVNLLSDPGFEGGHQGWLPFGDSTILDVDGEGREGTRCIHITERPSTFSGPGSPLLQTLVDPDRRYRADAWVRMESDADTVGISLKSFCAEDTAATYTQLTSAAANAADWTFLSGEFSVPSAATCTLNELIFYIEGPDPINAFYVDDVGLYLVP